MQAKRVIRVVFESPPAADTPRKSERIRPTVLVLYPLEVKRQLAAVDNAKARAVQLARQAIQNRLVEPPDLEALNCSAERGVLAKHSKRALFVVSCSGVLR